MPCRRFLWPLLLLLVASPALGQGMGRQFAEPLSWLVLRDRLVLIAPSEPQLERIAVEHNVYLADFEILRDGSIASFLEDTQGMGAMTADDPDESRRSIARTTAIRADIANLDDAMFARIAEVLGESQQTGLGQVKQRRHRDRLRTRSSVAISGGGVPTVEPRDGIDWASLSDSDRHAVAVMLADWEDRYTTQLKAWARAQDKSEVSFMETLAELTAAQKDFSAESPPDAEQIAELINTFRAAQQEAQAALQPHVDRIHNHIMGGMKTLVDLLPPEQRFGTIQAVVPGVWLVNRVPRAVRGARRSGADTDTMIAIDAIDAEWQQDAAAFLIEGMEAKWKDKAAQQNMMMEASEDGGLAFELPKAEYTAAVRTRWETRHEGAIEAIAVLVPEVDREALVDLGTGEEEKASHTVESSTTAMVMGSSGDDDEQNGSIVVSSSVSSDDDPFGGIGNDLLTIPDIDQYVLDGLARDFSLDDAGHAALAALHATHDQQRLAMETERADERRALRKDLGERMKSGDMSQADQMSWGMTLMGPISREGLEPLDAAFFDGVTALTNDPTLVRPWRLARDRELSRLSGGMMSASIERIGVPDNRWKVDLLKLIEASELADADRVTARAAMASWHEDATRMAMDIKDSTDALDEGMLAMMKNVGQGGKMEIDLQAAMEVEKLQRAAAVKREALSALTQQTADAIADTVSDAESFRLMWLEQAFPGIAADDAFSTRYQSAARASGLTDQQRGAIAMLRAEHDEAWWLETEAAVAILTTERAEAKDQTQAFYDAQRIRQEVDRHTFARREAALKQLEKLRGILSEQQLAEVNQLPDPAAPRTMALPF